ncbi:hypothetical protein [Nesterenkonia pannonica]|uniref:hypothetical protein n=1 Tax=Nesterenkonia pannonica TaxID=1548602 RepID=UPI00216472D8|nr:hypothetical protein [Nesterenkonia pannonica]
MEWNSFNPSVSDFESLGYQSVVFSGSQCSNTGNAVEDALSTNSRVVVDARGCANGIQLAGTSSWFTSRPYNLQLRNHVVFLTDKLDMNRVNISSRGGGSYQLFAIGPDTGGNNQPTCSGGSFRLNQNVNTATNTPMMLYSPCSVTIGSNNDFSGQIYAWPVRRRRHQRHRKPLHPAPDGHELRPPPRTAHGPGQQRQAPH